MAKAVSRGTAGVGEQAPTKFYGGVIVVELGRARIRVEGAVDADSLRLILERVDRVGR
ncbi:MAG: hypothetical protein ABSE57_23295 [Bryobacteraceae bacterium]